MSVYENYKLKKPAEFTRLVGVNYGTFQIILQKLAAEIEHYKNAKPMRKRGLKTSSLSLADQLILPMLYLRQYHTFLQLADIFGISESYASKRYHFINKRLMTALDIPNDKGLSLENISLVADVTEQEIERPLQEQKSYYSGKKTAYDKNTLGHLLFNWNHPSGEMSARHSSRL